MRHIIEKLVSTSITTTFQGTKILQVMADPRGRLSAFVEEDDDEEVYTDLVVFRTDGVIISGVAGGEWEHVESIDGLHLYRKQADPGEHEKAGHS